MDDFEVVPVGTTKILNMLQDYWMWLCEQSTIPNTPPITELTVLLDELIKGHGEYVPNINDL